MKRLGLEGVRRGKIVRTTVSDKALPCPLDTGRLIHRCVVPYALISPGQISTGTGGQFYTGINSNAKKRISLKEPLNNCHFEHSEKSILLIAKDSSLRSE